MLVRKGKKVDKWPLLAFAYLLSGCRRLNWTPSLVLLVSTTAVCQIGPQASYQSLKGLVIAYGAFGRSDCPQRRDKVAFICGFTANLPKIVLVRAKTAISAIGQRPLVFTLRAKRTCCGRPCPRYRARCTGLARGLPTLILILSVAAGVAGCDVQRPTKVACFATAPVIHSGSVRVRQIFRDSVGWQLLGGAVLFVSNGFPFTIFPMFTHN